MFKKLTIILILALLSSTAWAQTGLVYHEIQVVDEIGRNVTDITNLYIYAPGGTTDAVIYMDPGLQNVITIPMTEASANTTLVDGYAYWWGPDGWDFSLSNANAAGPLTNSGHLLRTSSDAMLVFPSYLQSMSTTAWLDAQSISMGTGAEWVINGGGVADTLSFVPAADDSSIIFGHAGTAYNVSFYNYVSATEGFIIDSSVPSLAWTGGAATINHDSNSNVGICTGTSTGAVSIGSATAGTVAVDTTAGITINADDSIAVTVSAGTYSIAATGGDITIDGTDSSVIIRGTEAASDAILLDADAGSIDVDSADNITIDVADDITIDTADGKIHLIADGATGGDITLDAEDIIKFLSTSTAAAAYDVDVTSTGGDMTWNTSDGGMTFTTAGAANGDVTFTVADKFSVTSTDTAAAGLTLIVNGGAAETIHLNSKQGTSAAAINIDADVGGITLLADGAAAGDITLDAEDDIILTTTGKLTITNTEAVTISGDETVTGTLSVVGAYVNPFEIAAATNEIEITESGTVFVLNHGTEFATTLPTVASSAGVTFRFIVGVDPAGVSFTVVTDSLEDAIEGVVVVNGAAVPADGPDDTITFTASAAVVGDWCELTSDGVLWYLSGQAHAATGIVPTKAD